MNCTRREFVNGLTLAGTAGLLGVRPETVGAEPPPETTTLILFRISATRGRCDYPGLVADELLRAEGFTDVRYVKKRRAEADKALAEGEIHFSGGFAGSYITQVDAGRPVVLLTGQHVGCLELFATDRVRTVRELKGKTVSVSELNSARHVFLASALAYVGLDPRRDVSIVEYSSEESIRLLAEGKIDGFLAFGGEGQDLRTRKIGHTLLNSALDRPWSQYYCCMIVANREFVRKHPVATKRALRAWLKATTICALEPDRVARFVIDKGYAQDYEHTLQMLKEIPYTWREHDPTDTIRFYSVRLHEAGMIKSSPQKIIAQGTDWRFLNELKKELKG